MCKTAAVLLALLIVMPAVAAPAPPAMGRISGIVTIGDMPLPGATVTIEYGGKMHTLVTSIDGRFVYEVPLGAVGQVSVDMEGLKSQKRTVALTSAAASRDFTFAMKLREGEMTAIIACAPSPVEEPNTYRIQQSDVDKLPMGRSIDNILDLLPGTH